jgi:hypothetical protein
MIRIFLISLMMSLFIQPAIAQDELISDLKEIMKAGSSKEMAKHLNQTVDLSFDGKTDNLSKTQAEYVLRDFFKKNPPSNFSIVHQGSSKSGIPFVIGQYSSNDDNYRVVFRIRAVNKVYLVHGINFTKE